MSQEDRDLHEKVVSGRAAVALPPSPGPGKGKQPKHQNPQQPAVKGKKGKKGTEPHVYSSLDLHHVHDVHVDSKLIAHEGMLSGDDAGDAFDDYERNVLSKIGSWGKKVRKAEWGEEEFNLDTYQLRRLTQIMDRVRVRRKQESKMANLFRAEDRKRYRMELLQELVIKADESFRIERIIQSKCSDLMRYTCVGDETRLRQELEVYGKKLVNVRDMKMAGHTLLHEAVGRGHMAIVRMLLSDYHANPNVATLMGWTSPLHLAVEKDLRQIAAYLIAFGANLRALDSKGRIPLHYVQSIPVMKLLLKYTSRFDPCTKSTEGLMPSEHYAKYTDPEVIIPPLTIMLEKAQEAARHEAAKLERLAQQSLYDRTQGIVEDFPLAISQNSSLIDSQNPGARGLKNAYKYRR